MKSQKQLDHQAHGMTKKSRVSTPAKLCNTMPRGHAAPLKTLHIFDELGCTASLENLFALIEFEESLEGSSVMHLLP